MLKFQLYFILIWSFNFLYAQEKPVSQFNFIGNPTTEIIDNEWRIMTSNSSQYHFILNKNQDYSNNNSLTIRSIETSLDLKYAGVGYYLPAKYEGSKITLTAKMRTKNMQGYIGLMLGIYDSNQNTLFFENLQRKKLKGTKTWKKYKVTLPLPTNAQTVQIAPLLIGKGEVEIRDVQVLFDNRPLQNAKLKADYNPNSDLKPNYGNNPKTGDYIKINDAKLYYEVYGSGEPLLLLHGNSQSIFTFHNQIPELSKNFKVIAVDTRGQGRSTDESSAPFTYDMFAEDMKQLLDSLKIPKANVLGWSDGGNTGLLMAIKYPLLVNKLAITGAVLSPTKDAVGNNVLKSIKKSLITITASDKESKTKKRLLKLLIDEPHIALSDLQSIRAKTLVMAGENDIVKINHTRKIAKNISDSKLVIFKNASHNLPVENAKDFNEIVLKFLNQN